MEYNLIPHSLQQTKDQFIRHTISLSGFRPSVTLYFQVSFELQYKQIALQYKIIKLLQKLLKFAHEKFKINCVFSNFEGIETILML